MIRSRNIRIGHTNRNNRGILKMEVMVATVILIAAMSFASTMVHRINRLWTSAQQHQFAISELSNQVESIVRLAPGKASEALETIDVSDACKETLKDASLSGEIVKDELGNRVTLKLTWNERKDANPVELSAWLRNAKAEGGDE